MKKVAAPPRAPEAEDCLLGSIMLNPKNYKIAEQYIVSDNVFWQDVSKALWGKITRCVRENKP